MLNHFILRIFNNKGEDRCQMPYIEGKRQNSDYSPISFYLLTFGMNSMKGAVNATLKE